MPQRVINVLFLGETGVGKSTFINMIPNYLTNATLSEVATKDLFVLIPTKFTILDENSELKTITAGEDSGRSADGSEVTTPGASATQRPRTYEFDLPGRDAVLRVVDTLGIGDTRGIERDRTNTETILRYISEFPYFDAVVVLLKPNDSRLSVLFDHCLRVIMKQLVARVRENLIFAFTNSRGTFYRPGDTVGPLKLIIEDIKRETNATIPFKKANTFCFDNETFRYLIALKNGVKFNDDIVERFDESYKHSSTEFKRLIDYIETLKPIPMQNVTTPNESKRIILRLSKPLISLITSYEKIMVNLKQYENTLQNNMSNLDLLKQNLFTIEHKKIIKEHIVETESRSNKFGIGLGVSYPVFSINADVSYNYSDDFNKIKVQDPIIVENRVFNETVYNLIKDEQSARTAVQNKVAEFDELRDEYKNEVSTILNAIATYYVYCKENNLTVSDDPFLKALETAKEEAELDGNGTLVDEYVKTIKLYNLKKNGLEGVFPGDIKDATKELFNLKHSGPTFKQLMNAEFTYHTVRFP